MDAINHAFCLTLIGRGHLALIFEAQKLANSAQHCLRLFDQLLEVHLILALSRHRGEKLENVFLTYQPDQLSQLALAEVVLMPEKDLLQARFFEGTDHRIGMSEQVQVTSAAKIALCAAQNLDVEGVGRRLIHQSSVCQPSLQQTIKLLCGELLVCALLHELFGCLSAALLKLHQGSQRTLEPEAEAPGKSCVALGQGVEGK